MLIALYYVSPLSLPASPKPDLTLNDFFAPTGESYALTEKIKAQMNDPNSYGHVETSRKIVGNTIEVVTKFRGKNKLGVKVLNTARAQLDKQSGQVLGWGISY